jgi:hypothetical protein
LVALGTIVMVQLCGTVDLLSSTDRTWPVTIASPDLTRGSAIELRDAETPDFFPVCRFERKHEALALLPQLSLANVIHV